MEKPQSVAVGQWRPLVFCKWCRNTQQPVVNTDSVTVFYPQFGFGMNLCHIPHSRASVCNISTQDEDAPSLSLLSRILLALPPEM